MIINLYKTKELVFKSPNPRLYVTPHPLDEIEKILEVKLLRVVLDHNLNIDIHVDFVLTLCSQHV